MKRYSIKFGNAPAETVDENQLAAMKQRYGSRFGEFEVKELKEPAKPADLTKEAALAESKSAKADKSNKSE